jgi:hypothetical protein
LQRGHAHARSDAIDQEPLLRLELAPQYDLVVGCEVGEGHASGLLKR